MTNMLQAGGMLIMTKEEFRKELSAAARLGGNFHIGDFIKTNEMTNVPETVKPETVDMSKKKVDDATKNTTEKTQDNQQVVIDLVDKVQKQLTKQLDQYTKKIIDNIDDTITKGINRINEECEQKVSRLHTACEDAKRELESYNDELVSSEINKTADTDDTDIGDTTGEEAKRMLAKDTNVAIDERDKNMYNNQEGE